MKISEISIKNHVFAWMLMYGLLLFGAISFKRMGVSQLPNVDMPMVSVSVDLDGASPEVIEMTILDPLETALTTVPGIKSMTSSARTGSASVTVEFDISKDIDVAVADIQSALSRIQSQFPSEAELPTVRKSNPDSHPIMWLSVSSEKLPRRELMAIVRDRIKDRFSTIEGVGDVRLGGYVDPALRVYPDPKKLAGYQLTALDVVSAIKREHVESPGGRIETASRELNIRTLGEAVSVHDFENLIIGRRGGALNYNPIPIKSVAKVEDSTADIRSYTRANGNTAVGMGIQKQPGSNAVGVAKLVKKRIEELMPELPAGMRIDIRYDSTTFIEEAVSELNFTLVLSAILTSLVCWLFLGSWTATINVIMAIPTSVVGSFIVLYALGFTLNTFTLLGLSLAIGIVVDDAIMVLENIVRHIEMKKGRREAALDGSNEIGFAALAATMAIIAIFLPVAFMEGVIGKYFLEFGVTISVAVAISLLEALTLTPMRSSRFLTIEPRTSFIGKSIENGFIKSAELYKRSIGICIRNPWKTIFFALFVFAGTLLIGKNLKKEFVPSEDMSRLMIRFQAPPGSSLEYTDSKMRELEEFFSKRPETEGYFASIGGGMGTSQVNTGLVFLTLKDPRERKESAAELANIYRAEMKKFKGGRVSIQDPSLNSFASRRGFPVEFTVKGPDWNQLADLSTKLMDAMEKSGKLTDVDTNYQTGLPEIQILPNRDRAKLYGVEIADINSTVSFMMSQVIAGKYSSGGRRYDIRVGLPKEERGSLQNLGMLLVRNNRGELIPLKDLVTITEKPSLQTIFREDRTRAISVYGNMSKGVSQEEAINLVSALAKEILPEGYYAIPSGSSKTYKESSGGLLFALLLGIVVAYMVLGAQFNSFIHPITILLALPFSLSGALVALQLGGQSLNLYSFIGIILLMGIVKKNSILLVEFTQQKREEGMDATTALLTACPTRLRPILMTTVSTIAGALPPALSIGPGAESRIPMALAVIGGVIVSTLLTLFVVPSSYLLFDRMTSWWDNLRIIKK